jgi:hypothetical protein
VPVRTSVDTDSTSNAFVFAKVSIAFAYFAPSSNACTTALPKCSARLRNRH